MAAQPFGGHPTLAQYCIWAQEQGCRVEQGIAIGDDGKPYNVTKIIHPASGRWVIEAGTQHREHLAPTTVDRLDRRLGLNSPFPKMPN